MATTTLLKSFNDWLYAGWAKYLKESDEDY